LRCSALVCDSRFVESLHRALRTAKRLQSIHDSRVTIQIFKELLIR
jgi:hypothetical protein